MSLKKRNWIPEIMYEEADDGATSNLPFILVPNGEIMPKILFVFESRDTGEFEPNDQGDPVPIMEMDLHQYADDKVRDVLGLQPLKQAAAAGSKITENVRKNLEIK
jgi:hypothetical protein